MVLYHVHLRVTRERLEIIKSHPLKKNIHIYILGIVPLDPLFFATSHYEECSAGRTSRLASIERGITSPHILEQHHDKITLLLNTASHGRAATDSDLLRIAFWHGVKSGPRYQDP